MASVSLEEVIIEQGCRRLACSAFYLRRGFVCLSAFSKGVFSFCGMGLSLRTAFFLIFIFVGEGMGGSAGAFLGCLSLSSFDCFCLRSFSTGFLASLRGRRRALGFLPLPRLRIRLAKSNAKDGFRVLGS